jgi:competence protein ComGC
MKNKKAFTMIEVLIVAFLSSIVGLGVVTAIAQSNRVLNETVLQTMTNINIQQVMYDLSKDVKEGVALSVPYPDGYNLEMKIHYADGSAIQWKYDFDSAKKEWYPIRINSSGSIRRYRMIGTRENGQYKQYLPLYLINRDPYNWTQLSAGKYHKAYVQISYWDGNANYYNYLATSTFYCKHVANNFGY